MLNILLYGSEIIAFIKCKILVGIPLGPEHLLIFRSDTNSSISILSQVPKTNELGSEVGSELERYSANGLSPLYFFFDRRSSAIVEKYVLKALVLFFLLILIKIPLDIQGLYLLLNSLLVIFLKGM